MISSITRVIEAAVIYEVCIIKGKRTHFELMLMFLFGFLMVLFHLGRCLMWGPCDLFYALSASRSQLADKLSKSHNTGAMNLAEILLLVYQTDESLGLIVPR